MHVVYCDAMQVQEAAGRTFAELRMTLMQALTDAADALSQKSGRQQCEQRQKHSRQQQQHHHQQQQQQQNRQQQQQQQQRQQQQRSAHKPS